MKIQEYIEISGISIPIRISNNRRAMSIRMTIKEGYLSVYKPTRYPMHEVYKLLNKHENTIYLEYMKMLERVENSKTTKRQWNTGDSILYHGIPCKMVRVYRQSENEYLEIKEKKLYFFIQQNRTEEEKQVVILGLLKLHLKEETRRLLSTRLPLWSQRMGLVYEHVKVRYAKTRWGSCVPSRKSLNFNALLAMFPEAVVDAVIVHELSHLKEQNHGKAFWNLVYQYIPEYPQYNEWLKKHREDLKLE